MDNNDPKVQAWKADQLAYHCYNQGVGGIGITHDMRSDKRALETYPEHEERIQHRMTIFQRYTDQQLRNYIKQLRIRVPENAPRAQLLSIIRRND